ncbi:helix-turn-helix domain-containing protein [Sulfitobacter sp. HNIBRBA2951]|uniref:helix-turn-helix domain-containing protein n=1 Tax=Sulfitobacter aquimarinus TaxID=3158557 RepID=UPI0032DE3C31
MAGGLVGKTGHGGAAHPAYTIKQKARMVAAIRAPLVNVVFDTVRFLVPDSIIAPESPQALPAVHGAFMSKNIDCDPSKGFVAFPVALFDLDLSPGAFRTLAELCRMANVSGQCWPSLAQLGRRLGRSRAAVSGYIAELREADVLTTQEQKMANGYNYRLRYTVTFWKEWRAGLGKERKVAAPVQKPERRVQPSERPLETKNHIHKNKQGLGKFACLVSDWKRAVGNAPYPTFDTWPSEALVASTEEVPDGIEPAPIISADIDAAIKQFCDERGLNSPTGLGQTLSSAITSGATLSQLMSCLAAQWQPHWKNPPNAFQLKRLLDAMPPACDVATEHKLLKSYLRRWNLHLRSLPSSAIRSTVAA